MKIDGRDISESRYGWVYSSFWNSKDLLLKIFTDTEPSLNFREIGIAEQVDYLLKQAASVDNLCNMYEGWTPWI